jgi:hypothetical protein
LGTAIVRARGYRRKILAAGIRQTGEASGRLAASLGRLSTVCRSVESRREPAAGFATCILNAHGSLGAMRIHDDNRPATEQDGFRLRDYAPSWLRQEAGPKRYAVVLKFDTNAVYETIIWADLRGWAWSSLLRSLARIRLLWAPPSAPAADTQAHARVRRRLAYCRCRRPLDSRIHPKCRCCGWLVCQCGSCGC